MSAPVSAVHICNLALDHIKQDAISSIDPPSTKTETVCARWYDPTRRAVLRKHPWNFAIMRTTLPRNSTDPDFGYSAAYDLPNNFVRLLTIGDDSVDDNRLKYQIENGQLLYNSDDTTALKVRYIYDHTNVAKFDALFIDILAVELAMRMAYKFTGGENSITRLAALLKAIAPEGYAVDGQERPPQRIERSRFLQARRGNRSSSAGKNTVFPE